MKNQIAMHKKLSLGLLVIVLSVLFVSNCHAQKYKSKFAEADKKFHEAMNNASKDTDAKLATKIDELKVNLGFSAYEKAKVDEQDQLTRYKAKQDSLFQKFLFEFIGANVQARGIDPKRISLQGDSVKLTKEGVLLILKKQK